MIIGTIITADVLLIAVLIMLFVFMGLPLVFPGAPFIPSFRRKRIKSVQGMIEFVSKIAPGNKMADIGSGDGRVVIEFARYGFESTGVEINPFLVLWSRMKIKRLGLKNAKIVRKNFWKYDFTGFDIIYVFQLTSVNALLTDKFRKELKTGAIVISAGFILPGFEPLKREGIFWIYRN